MGSRGSDRIPAPLPRRAGMVALAVTLAAGAAGAAILELPATLPVTTASLLLDLDDATVEVVVGPQVEPALAAGLRSESADAAASLDVDLRDGGAVVRRHGEGRIPLLIRLSLGAGQRLSLAGSDLDVVVRYEGSPLGDDSEEEPPQGEGAFHAGDSSAETAWPGPLFDLDVERSTVQLFGIGSAHVTAVDSSLYTRDTVSPFELDLDGGDLELRGHRGDLTVRGRDAGLDLEDHAGGLVLDLGGGRASLSGRGNCAGTLRGGSLEVVDWTGPVKISGNRASVEVRSSPESRLLLTLSGRDLEVLAAPFRGTLAADLLGGSLTVRDQEGNARIRAHRQAEVAVERVRGEVQLTLDGASARLSEIAGGPVKAEIAGGRLDLEQAAQLDLTATGAEIYVHGLERLRKAQATDSYLELDLRDLQHHPRLELAGTTEAWVTLATPCTVKLSDEQLLHNHIDVSGCELEGRVARRNRLAERGVEGNRRLRLTAQVGEESSLRVEGRP